MAEGEDQDDQLIQGPRGILHQLANEKTRFSYRIIKDSDPILLDDYEPPSKLDEIDQMLTYGGTGQIDS